MQKSSAIKNIGSKSRAFILNSGIKSDKESNSFFNGGGGGAAVSSATTEFARLETLNRSELLPLNTKNRHHAGTFSASFPSSTPEDSGVDESLEKWNAFETEALPFMPDLFRVAMWLTRNRTDAEDLVQETFFQALRSFHSYQTGTNCRAWLATIMQHVNSKRLKKLGRLKTVDDSEGEYSKTVAGKPPIPDKLTDEEIIAAMEKVPENFRQVVVLADIEEFSYKEIANILNIPIGTVMSRLARGRKVLRVELADYTPKQSAA